MEFYSVLMKFAEKHNLSKDQATSFLEEHYPEFLPGDNGEEDLFETLWKKYGVSREKKAAKRVWKSLPIFKKQLAKKGLKGFLLKNPDPNFRPHFSRYLSGERYMDVLSKDIKEPKKDSLSIEPPKGHTQIPKDIKKRLWIQAKNWKGPDHAVRRYETLILAYLDYTK